MRFSDNEDASRKWWEGAWGAALGVFAISFAVFICYHAGGKSRFLYDDINLIVLNTRIRDFSHFKELILSGRPIRSLTFMLDYALWGYNPSGYHLTNTILQMISASLFFLFVRKIFRNAALAFGAGLLFATHPAATEAVAAVSHRKEVLALIFMLVSLLAYYSASRPDSVTQESKAWPRPRWIYYFISFCAYFLAIGSKQVAIVTPLLMWVTDFLCSREPASRVLKNRWLFYVLPLVLPLGFFLIKMGDWRVFGAFPAEGMFSGGYFKILLISAWAVTQYLMLMLWPVHLHVDHYIPPDPSHISVIVGVALFLGLIMLAWRLRRNAVWSFGLFWIPINLAPILNLVPANESLAERYLYIPLAGGCLLLAVAIEDATRRAKLPGKLFKALIFLWIAAISSIWWRVLYWRYSDVTPVYAAIVGIGALILWGAVRLVTGKRYIGSVLGRTAICAIIISALAVVTPKIVSKYVDNREFWNQQQYSTTMQVYQVWYPEFKDKLDPQKLRQRKINSIAPIFPVLALALIAGIIGGAKVDEKAGQSFALGISLMFIMFGALTFHRAEEWLADQRLWVSTLRENPQSSKAAVNLAITSRKSGNFRSALWAYRHAATMDPKNALLHYDFGLALLRLGRFEEAESEFKETIKYEPRHVEAHLNLGNIYQQNEKFIAAANEYREVLQLDQKNVKAMYNLALVYQKAGEMQQAMDICRQILAIMPDFQKALEMCGN